MAFLVDAEAYYDAFARAAARARHRIFILGWDFDTRTRLWPGRPPLYGMPAELGRFLSALLSARPELEVYVLAWDYSVIYTFERELLARFNPELRSRPNLRFKLDSKHPPGASHHQKIVVIDDAVAFLGGLDLAVRRWDSSAHLAVDPRRVDPRGEPYAPFHDVQVALAGQAAAALGDLCRDRWRRAGGASLQPVPPSEDPWPEGLSWELEHVSVGLARTEPGERGRPRVREIEHLFMDGIAGAREFIYIENQYLTSAAILDGLSASLARRQGPEVVIVAPGRACGWLEERTMGMLRDVSLRRLTRADRHDRLRLCYPVVGSYGSTLVNLHDKLFIADDRLLHLGSANLSNRSLALDTECNFAIEAPGGSAGDGRIVRAIRALRCRLLAEHLGCEPGAVEAAQARAGSLIATIDELSRASGGRTLRAMATPPVEAHGEILLPHPALIDPEKPLRPALVVEHLVPEAIKKERRQPFMRAAVILAVLLALAATWNFTPIREWVDVRALLALAEPLRASPLAPVITTAAFLLGGAAMVPLTLMVIQTGAVFGPVVGALYAFVGALASAATAFWIGRAAGHDVVHRLFATRRLRRVQAALGRRSLFIVIAIRLLPVAPFTVVNLAAGASRIRFRHYLLGTVIGMAPGVLALAVFGYQLGLALVRPNALSYLVLCALFLLIVLAGVWFRRRVLSAEEEPWAVEERRASGS